MDWLICKCLRVYVCMPLSKEINKLPIHVVVCLGIGGYGRVDADMLSGTNYQGDRNRRQI